MNNGNAVVNAVAGQVEVSLKDGMALVTTFGLTPHGDRNEMMSLQEAWDMYPGCFSLQLAGD